MTERYLRAATRAAWQARPMAVEVVTSPSPEGVVDPSSLRAHVSQPLADDDVMLQEIASAAYDWAEAYLGRRILTTTLRAWYDGEFAPIVLLPEPVASVSSVKAYTEADLESTVATSVYQVDTVSAPARLVRRDGQLWPYSLRDTRSMAVEYVAGYGTAQAVPQGVKQALKMLVAHWYAHRQPVAAGSMTTVPMGVESLLRPYRVRAGVA